MQIPPGGFCLTKLIFYVGRKGKVGSVFHSSLTSYSVHLLGSPYILIPAMSLNIVILYTGNIFLLFKSWSWFILMLCLIVICNFYFLHRYCKKITCYTNTFYLLFIFIISENRIMKKFEKGFHILQLHISLMLVILCILKNQRNSLKLH